MVGEYMIEERTTGIVLWLKGAGSLIGLKLESWNEVNELIGKLRAKAEKKLGQDTTGGVVQI